MSVFGGGGLRHRVLKISPGDEPLAIIRIKAKFFNTSLIEALAPTKKDDVPMGVFYERLDLPVTMSKLRLETLMPTFNPKHR